MMEEEKLSATTSPVKETARSGSKLISRDVQTDKYSSAAGIFHSSSSSEKVKSHFYFYTFLILIQLSVISSKYDYFE